MNHKFYIRNAELKFLVIGGLSSRAITFGWLEDRKHAEPFDTSAQALDFLGWLAIPDRGFSIIDYADIPSCPPDAEQRRVETPAEREARVRDEERGRFLQRSRWGIKTAAPAIIALALLVPAFTIHPAAAAPHPHRSYHHVIRARVAPHVHRARPVRRLGIRSVHAPALSLIGRLLGGSSPVQVAERYLGSNPTGRASLWCADFMNLVERQVGRAGTGSRAALSFLHYGHGVSDPLPGDIVVIGRRGGGHVGYFMGMTARGPQIISGNYGHHVGVGIYPASRVAAYRRPA